MYVYVSIERIVSICKCMYLHVCMSVVVRIARICTYMYVFLKDINLDTCKYLHILTIRTRTYIRTGYVQCANVLIG
jgi:hypothetical protein